MPGRSFARKTMFVGRTGCSGIRSCNEGSSPAKRDSARVSNTTSSRLHRAVRGHGVLARRVRAKAVRLTELFSAGERTTS